MGEDSQTLTQKMLRKWHEETFPGLTDEERAERIQRKWLEESVELHSALEIYKTDPDTLNEVRAEMADVLITLMSLAEFLGVNLTEEAIRKHNVNTNRVWVQYGTDTNGKPLWKRERDGRSDLIKDRISTPYREPGFANDLRKGRE